MRDKPHRGFRWLSVVAIGALVLGIGCGPRHQPAPVPINAVGTVGTAAITVEDLQREWARRAAVAPGRAPEVRERQAALEELIQFEALHQKALAAGYGQDPEIVAGLKRSIVAKYREDQLAKLTPPQLSADDLTNYYQQHPERFGAPEKVRAAVIEMKVARTAAPEKRAEVAQRAADVRAEAVAIASAEETFGALAQKYSDDQATRYRGGDLGWMLAGATNADWPPEVMQAVAQLKEPRAISPVIETPTAFYLIKLVDRQPATLRPFAEVREGVAYLLAREREQQQQAALGAAATQGLAIRIHQNVLEAATLSGATTAPPAFPGGVATTQPRRSP
jgi:parvulin-like peptidyl-prolyl isomerase